MNPLAEARALLPLWVRLFPWLAALSAGVLAYLLTRLAMRLATRPLPAEPWTERARIAYAPRQLGQLSRIVWLAVSVIAALAWPTGWATEAPAGAAALLVTFAWGLPAVAALHFESRLRALPMRRLLRSLTTSLVALQPGLFVMLVATPFAMLPGITGVVVAAAAHVTVAALTIATGLPLGARVGLAHPASPRLQAVVARAAARTGVQVRRVYELDWSLANAVAFPAVRTIAFTRPALEVLDDAELEAVAAHELGHLSEPLSSRLMRPALVIALAAIVLWGPRTFAFNLQNLLGALAVLAVLIFGTRFIGRGGEQHADATAKDEHGVYARALETIYRVNLVPAVLRRPGIHGHLYDRLIAAGTTPSWPRPEPPRFAALPLRLLIALVPLAALLTATTFRVSPAESVLQCELALALGDTQPWPPAQLAHLAGEAGRADDAVTFSRAAHQLAPSNVWVSAQLAAALAVAHRCTEAQTVLANTYQLALDRRLGAKTKAELDGADATVERLCR